jgi:diguanylate cyclase (GGDEF)-like protein/PAS domain S-box-containing protein
MDATTPQHERDPVPTVPEAHVTTLLAGHGWLGIFALDADLNLVYANEAASAIAGRNLANSLGRNVIELIHPDDVNTAAVSLPFVADGRASLPTVVRSMRDDGGTTPIEVTVQAVTFDRTDLRYVLTVREAEGRLALDDIVTATSRGDLPEAMHALVRLLEADGDFRCSIHWWDDDGSMLTATAPPIDAIVAQPGFAALVEIALEERVVNGSLDRFGLQPAGSGRLGFCALGVGRAPDLAVVIGWLPYADAVGPAGRALFDRVAGLAALAIERHGLDTRLRNAAATDHLTGVANRKAFGEEFARLGAQPGSFGLLLLDLDGFKAINDAYGHAIGDEALVVVADRLRAGTSDGTVIARLGGDEFALLVPGIDRHDAVDALTRRVRALVDQPIWTSAGTVALSTSIGAVLSDPAGHDEGLLARADAAMYADKRTRSGRGRRHT